MPKISSKSSPKRNDVSHTPAASKKTVVIGLLGTKEDKEGKESSKWRPSIHLAKEFPIDEYYLLYQRGSRRDRFFGLATNVKAEIEKASPKTDVILVPIRLDDPWDFESVYKGLYDFVQNHSFCMPMESEDRFVHLTTGTEVAKACWSILAFQRFFRGKLIQSQPEGAPRIIDPDLEKYRGIVDLFKVNRGEGKKILKLGVETRNPEYNKMIDEISVIAAKADENDPILLLGETGVGKTILAKAIFDYLQESGRFGDKKDAVFQQINCAALTTSIVEGELFGYVEGAYTGASVSGKEKEKGGIASEKKGLLDSTNGGVLFLDEIGDLDMKVQAALLTAIDNHEFLRVGGREAKTTDYRLLICGTNRDLRKRVRAGKFREDLLARIDTFSYTIPSLADRREDIEPYLDKFIEEWNKEKSVAHQQEIVLAGPPKMEFIKFAKSESESAWNANLRDLKKFARRAAMFAEKGTVTKKVVKEEIEKLKAEWVQSAGEVLCDQPNYTLLAELIGPGAAGKIDDIDLVQLLHVIDVCRKCRTCKEAAGLLFNHSETRNAKSGNGLKEYLERTKAFAPEKGYDGLSFEAIRKFSER